MKEWKRSVGTDRTRVSLQLEDTGHGMTVLLTGGTTAHIGAVVLALPRPSLTGDGGPGCDTYVVPVPGHKDFIPAKSVAEFFSKALCVPVVVSCGIHSDAMSQNEIKLVLSQTDELCRNCLAELE